MGVRFYCGVSNKRWNKQPARPGEYACVSPIYGKKKTPTPVKIEDSKVLQDSGAFQDDLYNRLTFKEALDRQINHAEKYGYSDKIEYRVSYDILIDEVWENGVRSKKRWELDEAEYAVEETIKAAKYLSENRNGLKLVLSAQGVDENQYLNCVKEIVPFMDLENDVLGLGGWCIIGKMRKQMMPVFKKTLLNVIPYLSEVGVKKVHIFGVIFPEALGNLLWMCDNYNIKVSTDSTSPQLYPVFGNWGYGNWRDKNYQRPKGTDTIGYEREKHVIETRKWLDKLEDTIYYKKPEID